MKEKKEEFYFLIELVKGWREIEEEGGRKKKGATESEGEVFYFLFELVKDWREIEEEGARERQREGAT